MTFKPADKAEMLKELARDDTTVDLDPTDPWSFGSGINTIGEGTTLDGHGATLAWPTNMGRLRIDHAPGVTLRNINLIGWVNIHNVVSPKFTCEDVTIVNSLPGAPYLNIGAAGGATGAFNIQGDAGTTLSDLTFKRCVSDHAYHHGFNMNLQDHGEGGGFADVLFEECAALSPGSGFEGGGARDWSCGFDIPDAGDIARLTVKNCRVDDPWQDGFHLDGSWDGHRQRATDVLFQGCTVTRAGRRCSAASVEKFRSGFYLQSGTLIDCHTENCLNAGFALVNETSDSLTVRGCSDTGSTYGMILNYAAFGADIEFRSEKAKVRAFVGQAGNGGGTLDLTVIDPPTIAATFGRALRIDYIDCPGHAASQRDKYDGFGYTLDGSKIIIRYVGEKPAVETWKTSHVTGSPRFAEADPVAPPVETGTIAPPKPIPPENTLGEIAIGPYDAIRFSVPLFSRDVVLADPLPPELRKYFRDGVYRRTE